MGLFNKTSRERIPEGFHLGRELAHHEHRGWRKLVLVRHGQTDFNVKHLLPGQLPGIPLNETGRAEAQATATSLHELPLSGIVASPLDRTLETAAFINEGRGLPIQQDRDLLDTNYGRFSGQSYDVLDKSDKEWSRFMDNPLHAPKGVESFSDVQKRAVRAAQRWRHEEGVGEWVALVTHADLVKLIIAHYIGIPLTRVPLINMDNASISLLAFHPEPERLPALICFNWTSPAEWVASAKHP
jgi:broad specificity phosphatase PhoE